MPIAGERVTPDLLIRLLRTGRVPVFVEALARYSEVPPVVARRIVLDADGESLAMVCRASRIERSDFGTIFMLMVSGGNRGTSLAPQRLQALMTLFDETRPDQAQRVLTFWRRNPDYLDAVERMERVVVPAANEGGRNGSAR